MSTDNATISIALVDDQLLFRRGLKAIFSSDPALHVVIEAENGKEFLNLLSSSSAEIAIALLDLEMPVMNGTECIKRLQQSYPGIKCIVLSVHNDPAYIARTIELGARAYLQKNTEPDILRQAINQVHKTGFYLEETTMLAMHRGFQEPNKNRSVSDDVLSAREKEVLQLICSQYTTAEIAEKLFISERTVDGHRNNLLQKTGKRNVAGLVVFAIQNGIYHVADGI